MYRYPAEVLCPACNPCREWLWQALHSATPVRSVLVSQPVSYVFTGTFHFLSSPFFLVPLPPILSATSPSSPLFSSLLCFLPFLCSPFLHFVTFKNIAEKCSYLKNLQSSEEAEVLVLFAPWPRVSDSPLGTCLGTSMECGSPRLPVMKRSRSQSTRKTGFLFLAQPTLPLVNSQY